MSEKRRKQLRKRLMLLGAVLVSLSVLAGGTIAYFTAEETVYNVITTGELKMDLVEETTDGEPWPEGGISGVMPGMIVDKKAYVENEGDIEFYTRMRIGMEMEDRNGKRLSAEHVELDINTKDWTEKDGYYYYKKPLKPGEKTEPLFTKVSFDVRMGNEYMKSKLEIYVHAEAVQSKNNGTDALSASGWSAGK